MPMVKSHSLILNAYLAATSEAEYRVPIFRHVAAFPSDKNWTHIRGVKHVVARADDGIFFLRST